MIADFEITPGKEFLKHFLDTRDLFFFSPQMVEKLRTIALTFAIGSALAAVAGALLCSAYPSLSPYVGSMPGIKAFVAAVFGGIGSIPGAMIGGILLGVIENLSKAYISSQLSDAIVFGVLIVVLLVKPTGILGKNVQEKV